MLSVFTWATRKFAICCDLQITPHKLDQTSNGRKSCTTDFSLFENFGKILSFRLLESSLNKPSHHKRGRFLCSRAVAINPHIGKGSPVRVIRVARSTEPEAKTRHGAPSGTSHTHDGGSQEGQPSLQIPAGDKQTKHNRHSMLPSFIHSELVRGTAEK